jgi:hypothetical protein
MQRSQEETKVSYYDLREKFKQLLSDNTPSKAIGDSFRQYLSASFEFYFPNFLNSEEEKSKRIELLNDVIELFNASIKLNEAFKNYINDQSQSQNQNQNQYQYKDSLLEAINGYWDAVEKYKNKHMEKLKKAHTNSNYFFVAAIGIVASFVALEVSLILGAGLYAIIPGAVLALSLITLLTRKGNAGNRALLSISNSATDNFNKKYKSNLSIFKDLKPDSDDQSKSHLRPMPYLR